MHGIGAEPAVRAVTGLLTTFFAGMVAGSARFFPIGLGALAAGGVSAIAVAVQWDQGMELDDILVPVAVACSIGAIGGWAGGREP